MKLPAWSYTSSTGARFTFGSAGQVTPGRGGRLAGLQVRVSGRPDLRLRQGWGTGQPPDLAALLIGHQQQRSSHRAFLLRSTSCAMAEPIWASLEMLSLKKITPAAWPPAIARSSAAGAVSPG